MNKLFRVTFIGVVLIAFFVLSSVAGAEVTTSQNFFTRNLTIGSTGDDVIALQVLLETKGFLSMPRGVSKGYFGDRTKQALSKYQNYENIQPAIGYFGNITRAKINSVSELELKTATEYSVGGTGGYACSKPILMLRQRVPAQYLGDGKYKDTLTPVNPDEAKLFCHATWAEEYEGKITVLQKPEVLNLISKYEYKDVSIKALEFELIKSKGLVDRLLPQYKDSEIGCIIILETPNEKMVFLEDENLETFEQMDYVIFDQQLNKVSQKDRELFLENLR